jgi:ABC-type amino acid transport substrate-binding protein
MLHSRATRAKGSRARCAAAIGILALTWATPVRAQEEAAAAPASQTSLERIRSSGRLAFGYATDARPFSYRDGSGKAAGFAVGVCEKVAGELKASLGVASLTVDWVPVGAGDGSADLEQGKIDLLCSGSAVTAKGRQSVAYSIPIFENGISALMRADGSARLRAALEEQRPPYQPLWRGSAPHVFDHRRFAVVASSPAAGLLAERIRDFGLVTSVATVEDYAAGVARVLDGTADALFGERGLLLDAATRSASPDDVVVLARHYRFQPIALALARGDEDFRLAVDIALSRLYASPDFGALYAGAFGEADQDTVSFYRLSALHD